MSGENYSKLKRLATLSLDVFWLARDGIDGACPSSSARKVMGFLGIVAAEERFIHKQICAFRCLRWLHGGLFSSQQNAATRFSLEWLGLIFFLSSLLKYEGVDSLIGCCRGSAFVSYLEGQGLILGSEPYVLFFVSYNTFQSDQHTWSVGWRRNDLTARNVE